MECAGVPPPATTPCPRCGKAVAVRGERGACPACGLAVRFVDAEQRPCAACGKPLALVPGKEAVRCAACGAWEAADPSRPVHAETTCPRCRRVVEVPLQGGSASCRRCGAALRLADLL
jgi:LSD1 subclass zinc finger protein